MILQKYISNKTGVITNVFKMDTSKMIKNYWSLSRSIFEAEGKDRHNSLQTRTIVGSGYRLLERLTDSQCANKWDEGGGYETIKVGGLSASFNCV